MSRKISKTETVHYLWKKVEHRASQMGLKTPPVLQEMKHKEEYKLLQRCTGLTSTGSFLNKSVPKKGINLFVEHEEMITRIPYYSFEYVNAYYYSKHWHKSGFDLGT